MCIIPQLTPPKSSIFQVDALIGLIRKNNWQIIAAVHDSKSQPLYADFLFKLFHANFTCLDQDLTFEANWTKTKPNSVLYAEGAVLVLFLGEATLPSFYRLLGQIHSQPYDYSHFFMIGLHTLTYRTVQPSKNATAVIWEMIGAVPSSENQYSINYWRYNVTDGRTWTPIGTYQNSEAVLNATLPKTEWQDEGADINCSDTNLYWPRRARIRWQPPHQKISHPFLWDCAACKYGFGPWEIWGDDYFRDQSWAVAVEPSSYHYMVDPPWIVVTRQDGTQECRLCPDNFYANSSYTGCIANVPFFQTNDRSSLKAAAGCSSVGIALLALIFAVYATNRNLVGRLRSVKWIHQVSLLSTALIFVEPYLFFAVSKSNLCWLLPSYAAISLILAVSSLRVVAISLHKAKNQEYETDEYMTLSGFEVFFLMFGVFIECLLLPLMLYLSPVEFYPAWDKAVHGFSICDYPLRHFSSFIYIWPFLLCLWNIGLVWNAPKDNAITKRERLEVQVGSGSFAVLLLLKACSTALPPLSFIQVEANIFAPILLGLILTSLHVPTLKAIQSRNRRTGDVYIADERSNKASWTRMSRDQLSLDKALGEGYYGQAWLAKVAWSNSEFRAATSGPVVVKQVKENHTARELLNFSNECLIMSRLNHKNIVHLIGVCMAEEPKWLVMEHMNGGSLETLLRQSSEVRKNVSQKSMHFLAAEILSGCIYLQKEGYVHRDLAARNCLIKHLPHDVGTKPWKFKSVKICDFGLARDLGSATNETSENRNRLSSDALLPVAWSAPEALSGKLSFKSDVWSFGVLLWEIFTFCAIPYRKCFCFKKQPACNLPCLSNETVMNMVCEKQRNLLSFQEPCTSVISPSLRYLLAMCFTHDENHRISFRDVQKFWERKKTTILRGFVRKDVRESQFVGERDETDHIEDRYERYVSVVDSPYASTPENVGLSQAYV